MIEFLRDGGSKLVLCKDLSRFFRDYVEIGDYLERIFPFLGVRLIAVNDGYDSDDYKGTTAGLDVVMKCIVYGFYSRDLSLKVKTALTSRAHKGQYTRGNTPYGYLKDPQDKHHLVPDPVAAPIVKKIFAMAISGMTTGEIARVLNDEHYEPPVRHFNRLNPDNKRYERASAECSWTTNNVYVILRRLEYTGAIVSGRKKWRGLDSPRTLLKDKSEWIIVPGCHEPLVSQEEFAQAQKAIRELKTVSAPTFKTYLLRSLIHCGACGRSMTRCGNKRHWYKCDKTRFVSDSPCPLGERFYEDDLEQIVVASLSRLLQAVVQEDRRIQKAAAKSLGTAENMRQTVHRIEQSIRQNKAARMAAYERYSDGKISRDEFVRQRDQLAADTERLTVEKEALEEQLANMERAQASELHETAVAAEQFLDAENVTNEMLRTFIDRVLVFTGGRVEIVYRFANPFDETVPSNGSVDEP